MSHDVRALTTVQLDGPAVAVTVLDGVFDEADTVADLGCYVHRVTPGGSTFIRDVVDIGFLGVRIARSVMARTREFRGPVRPLAHWAAIQVGRRVRLVHTPVGTGTSLLTPMEDTRGGR